MRLSDQIDLLAKTLEEFGGTLDEGESVGEAAARVIGQLAQSRDAANSAVGELSARLDERASQSSTQSDKDRIAELEDELDVAAKRILELEATPAASDSCDTCAYLKPDGPVPRLCQNPEAIAAGHARRGYPVPAGHKCELCVGAA